MKKHVSVKLCRWAVPPRSAAVRGPFRPPAERPVLTADWSAAEGIACRVKLRVHRLVLADLPGDTHRYGSFRNSTYFLLVDGIAVTFV